MGGHYRTSAPAHAVDPSLVEPVVPVDNFYETATGKQPYAIARLTGA
jgi:hypothetical protein